MLIARPAGVNTDVGGGIGQTPQLVQQWHIPVIPGYN